MVLAAAPDASARRCAARPVGEARSMRVRLARRMSTTARRMVVLPVPGPPVMMDIFELSVVRSASACCSANSKPARCCAQVMAGSIFMLGSVAAVLWMRAIASAIRISALAVAGIWQAGPSSSFFSSYALIGISFLASFNAWMRRCMSTGSTPSNLVAFSVIICTVPSVCPSSSKVRMVCTMPASMRSFELVGKPRLRAILSAVLNPIRSMSSAKR